ncbi:hypothetical protein GH714_040643 [Hevea brasiliensis]|uniref:Uncharacterized protein n=1 Tax=Hevea brasiliensis TaxID=3981 RepID=A0A6A6KWB8_HEVBR|nr:hypothetical protein GH714_040643 [Hevea brasiliensis]
MARLPSFGPKSSDTSFDVEQPPPRTSSDPSSSQIPIVSQLPHLTDPKVIASMTRAISDVVQTRSVLQTLGPRPDHETVDTARLKLSEIESNLSKQLEEIVLSPRPLKSIGLNGARTWWTRNISVDKQPRKRRICTRRYCNWREMHVSYEKLLKAADQRLVIPDSIAGLENLEELNLTSNLLEALPDSIGLLHNLKILDASSNKLESLPDSISYCRSLLELDVSFNRLTYLPTNIGYELVNLKRLSVQLNKIRSLPTSIGEMRSLQHLDAHFNELQGLPLSIGRLTNLEILNLSNNFNDLTELPDTLGDLTNLKELDLSNNQIQALPDTFGRLDNLTKLNLEQNPLVIPPSEIVIEGIEAVKNFMAKRWLDILVEEERKSMLEVQEQAQTGWLTRSTSWMKNYAAGVSESVLGYLSPRSPKDAYLDQQLAANWPACYVSTLLVAGLLLTSTLVVIAARATVLAWITVLVLLAFAGKRRGVLVQQGRKITADVVMYLFNDCA